MKKIFCLFILVFAMAQMLSAQTEKAALVSEPLSVQDASSSDAPVKPVPFVRNTIASKSPLALSGTYEIGAGKTYDKLSTAVNDLVLQGVSGPVTFEFTDANYTDTSIVINAFAGQDAYPVVFKLKAGNPSARIFFTGGLTTRTWGVRFDSTNNVSFIGSTTVGQYPITFEVDTTVGNPIRNVFQIIRSDSIRLEGLKLIGHRRYSDLTAASNVWETSFVGSITPNTNLTFTNLWVLRCSNPFNLGGISNALRDNNVTVSYCDLGGTSYIDTYSNRGFNIFAVDNLTIFKNNIRRGKNFPAATTGAYGIIGFGGHSNLVISHNQIHDLEKYGSTGGAASGIRLQTNGPGTYSNARIFNNMIYDLRNTAGVVTTLYTQAIEGLAFGSTSPNSYGTVQVYNNTFHLTGSINPSSTGWAGCAVLSSAVAGDSIIIYNNIFSNEIMTTGSNSGTAIYADFINSPTPKRLNSNRNLFWYPHLPLYWSSLSFFAGADLATWNALTSQDGSSIEQSNPFFFGATDPHIVASSLSAAEGNASVVGFVTDDIDGQPRSGSTPDLGADEFTGTKFTFAISALIQGFYQDGNFDNIYGFMVPDTVTVELYSASSPCGSPIDQAEVLLDSSGYGVGKFNTGWTVGNSYYIVIKHINALETWSKPGGEQLNLSALQYSFLDSAKTYGNTSTSKKVGSYWTLINGDCNQDDFIDGSDYLPIVNNWEAGDPRMPGDTNGDQYIDGSDYLQIVNNFELGSVTPCTLKRLSKSSR